MAIISIDRTSHTISCTDVFSIPLLVGCESSCKNLHIKIIADYSEWIRWSNEYYHSPESVTFSTIGLNISRPKQADLLWLKRFATDSPDSFAWQLYMQFLNEVEAINPDRENRKKVIGKSAAPKHRKRQEMFRLSRWLYVYFQHWQTQPVKSYPDGLKAFCTQYGCSLVNKRPLYEAVAQALSGYYQDENLFSDDGTSLYSNHIKGKVKRITDALTSTNFLHVGTPLESFLKKHI